MSEQHERHLDVVAKRIAAMVGLHPQSEAVLAAEIREKLALAFALGYEEATKEWQTSR